MDDSSSNIGDGSAPGSVDLSLLSGANATFIAEMNRAWRANPASVDPHWASYFGQLAATADTVDDIEAGPSWGRPQSRVVGALDPESSVKAVAKAHSSDHALNANDMRAATTDSLRAVMLIRAYRIRGHLLANLDPLGLEPEEIHPELDPASYGFGDDDWDRPILSTMFLVLKLRPYMKLSSVFAGHIVEQLA